MTAIDIREAITLRAPTLDDIDITVALINAVSNHEIGEDNTDCDQLTREWTAPDGFCLETDARLAFASQGELIGYVEMWNRAPHVHPHIWGIVHPDYRGCGVGTHLFEWAEARACQDIGKAPAGAHVSVRAGAHHTNASAFELFRSKGYRHIRSYWQMRIALDPGRTPEPPEWPEGITLRPYVPGQDDYAVYEAVEDAFADHWGFVRDPYDEWLHWMTSGDGFDPALWFLAVDGDEIAGVSLCRNHRPADPDLGWVNVLGVRRPWRRRGLGLALLRHSFCELYALGKMRIGLGVDAGSLTGATRLYEKAGMYVDRQWDVYDKELRAGQEITTQALGD